MAVCRISSGHGHVEREMWSVTHVELRRNGHVGDCDGSPVAGQVEGLGHSDPIRNHGGHHTARTCHAQYRGVGTEELGGVKSRLLTMSGGRGARLGHSVRVGVHSPRQSALNGRMFPRGRGRWLLAVRRACAALLLLRDGDFDGSAGTRLSGTAGTVAEGAARLPDLHQDAVTGVVALGGPVTPNTRDTGEDVSDEQQVRPGVEGWTWTYQAIFLPLTSIILVVVVVVVVVGNVSVFEREAENASSLCVEVRLL